MADVNATNDFSTKKKESEGLKAANQLDYGPFSRRKADRLAQVEHGQETEFFL